MVFWEDILAIFGYIFKIFLVAKILTYQFMNRTFLTKSLVSLDIFTKQAQSKGMLLDID